MENDYQRSREHGQILQTERTQFKSWLRSNSFHEMKDVLGQSWVVEINYLELPHPNDIHGGIWQINIKLSTYIESDTLVDEKVFDKDKDQRILSFLQGCHIPLVLTPPQLEVESIEEARRQLANSFSDLKEKLKNPKIRAIMREKVALWLNRRMEFRDRS